VKAVLLRGPADITIEEVPVPEISDDEVLVEVKYCGICGSDVHSIPTCALFPAGTYLGHEFSGVVAKVGKNLRGWEIGARVAVNPLYICGKCYACRHGRQSLCSQGYAHAIGSAPGREHAGAFAKFVRVPVPEWRLHRLPDEVSFEQGALIDPLADSLHAVRMSSFRVGEHAVVIGTGSIGLGVITFLKHAGAGLIIAIGTNEHRRKLAERLGADYVLNPYKVSDLREKVLELTNGEGAEVIFECSGVAQAFQNATDFLIRGGEIVLVGVSPEDIHISPIAWVTSEWRLQSSMCYYADEFPMVIEFLKKGGAPINELVTSKIKLSNIIEDGFYKLAKPNKAEIKILVEPD
jgi:(R,R)-butanediol dehydrogenase/meso-butanediol dehydrogenase/diacetyl reductase